MDVIATDEMSGQQYFVLQQMAVGGPSPEQQSSFSHSQEILAIQPPPAPLASEHPRPPPVAVGEPLPERQSSLFHSQEIPMIESLSAPPAAELIGTTTEQPRPPPVAVGEPLPEQQSSLSHSQEILMIESPPASELIDTTTEQPQPEIESGRMEQPKNGILVYLLTKGNELSPETRYTKEHGSDIFLHFMCNQPTKRDAPQAGTSAPKGKVNNEQRTFRPIKPKVSTMNEVLQPHVGKEQQNKNNENSKQVTFRPIKPKVSTIHQVLQPPVVKEEQNKNNENNEQVMFIPMIPKVIITPIVLQPPVGTLGAMKPKKIKVANMHNVLQPPVGKEEQNKNNDRKKKNDEQVTFGAIKPKKIKVATMHNVLQPPVGKEEQNKNNDRKKKNDEQVTFGAIKPKKIKMANMHDVRQPMAMESTGIKEESKDNGNMNENNEEIITTLMETMETIMEHPIIKYADEKKYVGHEKKKNKKIIKRIKSIKKKVAIMTAMVQQIKSESEEK